MVKFSKDSRKIECDYLISRYRMSMIIFGSQLFLLCMTNDAFIITHE